MLIYRGRRVRNNTILRAMISETKFDLNDLVYPIFISEQISQKVAIPSMPGIFQYTKEEALKELKDLKKLGLKSFLLFGIPAKKDSIGSEAYNDDGIIQRFIREAKKEIDDILLITDVCLCEYTENGQCGIVCKDSVENDTTVKLLAKTAISHTKAGADLIAPSDMMDGRIHHIREALDREGFANIPIMSYSVKYASNYYAPFRDAADSAPKIGNRLSYQMDFSNRREAARESMADINEGADILMVKPGLAYLDIVREMRDNTTYPIAVYNVSGEFSMIKAASLNGWIDEKKIVFENMIAFKRAGADIIITYHAKDRALWLK